MLRVLPAWTVENVEDSLELYSLTNGRRLKLPATWRGVDISGALSFMREWRTEEALKDFGVGVDSEDIEHVTRALELNDVLQRRSSLPTARQADPLFARQVSFLRMFEHADLDAETMQQRLRTARVIIVGAGGWGSSTALLLARMGIGELVLIDPDVVEESNLNRQLLFAVGDVGRPKAEVAAERIHADLGGRTAVTAVVGAVQTHEDLAPYVRGENTLLLNPFGYGGEYFTRLAHMGLELSVPTLNYGAGWVGPLTVPGETACVSCVQDVEALHATMNRTRSGLVDQYGLEFGVISARVGINCSVAAWEVFQFISGCKRARSLDGIITIDTLSYTPGIFQAVPRSNRCTCA